MKLETLNEVKKLCAELGDLIHVSVDKQVNAKLEPHWRTDELENPYQWYLDHGELKGGRDAAAIRRKSMDLTHALAKLRKGE